MCAAVGVGATGPTPDVTAPVPVENRWGAWNVNAHGTQQGKRIEVNVLRFFEASGLHGAVRDVSRLYGAGEDADDGVVRGQPSGVGTGDRGTHGGGGPHAGPQARHARVGADAWDVL